MTPRLAVALMLVLFPLAMAAGAARDRLSVDALLDRASAGVAGFGDDLHGVVARERYLQTNRRWAGRPPTTAGAGEMLASRRLRSSLLLVHDRATPWQLHRDVVEVDGEPVADRGERLTALFADPSADAAARLRAITVESARFNLGHITRTINVPTFPLIVLHPSQRRRFRFRDRGGFDEQGVAARRVMYAERSRPRLVRGEAGRDVRLEGELILEEGSGALLRATVSPRAGNLASHVEVWFAPVAGLPRRVPARMWEWYWVDGPDRERYVEGDATYDQFRRYGTSAGEPIVR